MRVFGLWEEPKYPAQNPHRQTEGALANATRKGNLHLRPSCYEATVHNCCVAIRHILCANEVQTKMHEVCIPCMKSAVKALFHILQWLVGMTKLKANKTAITINSLPPPPQPAQAAGSASLCVISEFKGGPRTQSAHPEPAFRSLLCHKY